MQAYIDKCIDNMVKCIKENPDIEEFIRKAPPKTGYVFMRDPRIIRLQVLTDSDGHSGASFAVCVRVARQQILSSSVKRRRRSVEGDRKQMDQWKEIQRKRQVRFQQKQFQKKYPNFNLYKEQVNHDALTAAIASGKIKTRRGSIY